MGLWRRANARTHSFDKLYLSTFSDPQVAAYLKSRFPFWQLGKRRAARKIAKGIEDLAARPMLLTHIEVLVESRRQVRASFEVYEEMVDAWFIESRKLL